MRRILHAGAELVVRRLRQLVALDVHGNAGGEILDSADGRGVETRRNKGTARSGPEHPANAIGAGRRDAAVCRESGGALQPGAPFHPGTEARPDKPRVGKGGGSTCVTCGCTDQSKTKKK